MDYVFFALPVLLAVAGLAYYKLTRQCVSERFQTVARRRNGRVARATWILYPRLVLELEGAEAQISCLHAGAKGRSANTFAWVGCPNYPELDFVVRRAPGRVGMLERAGWHPASTGVRSFDDAFLTRANEPEALTALLDADVRAALESFDPERAVRVAVGRATAYRGGWQRMGETELRMDVSIRALPAEVLDLERLCDLVECFHRRLLEPAGRVRRAG